MRIVLLLINIQLPMKLATGLWAMYKASAYFRKAAMQTQIFLDSLQ